MTINIEGLDPAEILTALYNAAIPAALHRGYPHLPIDIETARVRLADGPVVNWYQGRALFVDLSGKELELDSFDAYNSRGARKGYGEEVLSPLLAGKSPGSDSAFFAKMADLGVPVQR